VEKLVLEKGKQSLEFLKSLSTAAKWRLELQSTVKKRFHLPEIPEICRHLWQLKTAVVIKVSNPSRYID
jgi:hypothetical protein